MKKLVYSAQETSKIINLGLNNTYKLLNENKIANIRIGAKILVPKSAIMAWLKQSTNNNRRIV